MNAVPDSYADTRSGIPKQHPQDGTVLPGDWDCLRHIMGLSRSHKLQSSPGVTMFPPLRPLSRSIVAGTGLCVLLATISACSTLSPRGDGGTVGDGQSDAVNVNVRYEFPSGGAPKCTGNLTWAYTPITLTGSAGRAEQFEQPRTYDVQANLGSNSCVFSDGQLGLKKGSWRIAATSTGVCDVDLQAAMTTVTFKLGSNCTQFPTK
jgi:hypothetical protein